ncbi:MAG: hypothetical protein JRI80_13220 [Deltaproteobacteria bacterium]|nr:hypothetical protein [Deltaproteobacteria bacterium]
MPDPTVTDVFNQLVLANGKLDQIDTNTFGQTAALNTLNGAVNSGFNNTVNALNIVAQINIEAVKLLFHLTKQTDTMICALEHISKNTCGILTQVTIQTQLQKQLRDDVDALRYIAESAHPEAALERQRHAELEAKIERCCPPDPSEPACKYEPCDQPEPAKEPRLPRIDVDDHDPNPDDHNPEG